MIRVCSTHWIDEKCIPNCSRKAKVETTWETFTLYFLQIILKYSHLFLVFALGFPTKSLHIKQCISQVGLIPCVLCESMLHRETLIKTKFSENEIETSDLCFSVISDVQDLLLRNTYKFLTYKLYMIVSISLQRSF